MGARSDPPDRAAFLESNDDQQSFLGDENDITLEYDTDSAVNQLKISIGGNDLTFNENGQLSAPGLTAGSDSTTFQDSQELVFGGDSDVEFHWDETASRFVLQDENANLGNEVFGFDTGNEIVFNEDGIDVDFRVESVNNTDQLQVDAANDETIVGGDLTVDGTTTEVDDVLLTKLTVEQSDGTDEFVVDADAATPHIDLLGTEVRGNLNYVGGAVDFEGTGSNTVVTLDDTFSLIFEDNAGNNMLNISSNHIEIPNSDLRIATGQAIEDGSGTARFDIFGSSTTISNDAGNRAFRADDGVDHAIFARSDTPIKFVDEQGSFDAVQYETGASNGLLRAINAGLSVEGDAGTVSDGIVSRYLDPQGIIASRSGSAYSEMRVFGNPIFLDALGSRIDLTRSNDDLRFANGQAIEDGGGTEKIRFDSNETVFPTGNFRLDNPTNTASGWDRFISSGGFDLEIGPVEQDVSAPSKTNAIRLINRNDVTPPRIEIQHQNGNEIYFGIGSDFVDFISNDIRLGIDQSIEGNGGSARLTTGDSETTLSDDTGTRAFRANSGVRNSIFAQSGTPGGFYDDEGGFDAVKYITSANSPGTLELTAANLDASPSDKMTLPHRTSDPTASAGDMWYRTDLD